MPKKPKSVSLAKVAKTYKKAHTKPKVNHSGAHFATGMGTMESRGSSSSKLTYKPKAMEVTVGGTRKGKGATIKKIGRA